MTPETPVSGPPARTGLLAEEEELEVSVTWRSANGRLEPSAVTIAVRDGSTAALTADRIRRLPLGSVIKDLRRKEVVRQDVVARTQRRTRSASDNGAVGPQRGRSLAPLLAEVADVYELAYRSGQGVTSSVAEHFGVSRSTAAKRIMAARSAGLLDQVGNTR